MQRLLLVCFLVCGVAVPALAADLPIAPYRPALLRPLYSWTGCYVGVNIGGGAAPQTFTDTAGTFAPPGADLGNHTSRGVVGGGQLGCDYQTGPFVLGLQGLYDLSGMKASNVQPNLLLWNRSFVQSAGTLTARAGYTVTPTLLGYVKGGGAWVHDLYDVSTPPGTIVLFTPGTIPPGPPGAVPAAPGTIVALGRNTVGGWTVGGGLEWAFGGGDWSAFIEYDYMHFGTSQVTYASTFVAGRTFPLAVSQSVNLGLLGINYRFFGGAPRF
jgi:outer membrane immunogenic protein